MKAGKIKLDGAIHLKVISGSETMGMDEIIFNYTAKKKDIDLRMTLLFAGWTKEDEVKKRTKKECLFYFLNRTHKKFTFKNKI